MTGYYHLFIQQTKILLWKNYLVAKRSWKLSILKLLLPSLFVILFYLVYYYSTRSNNSVSTISYSPIAPVIPCMSGPTKKCVTISYHPDTPEVRAILQSLADYNTPKLVLGKDISPIDNFVSVAQFRYDAILKFPNTTQTGLVFDSVVAPYNYTIIYNDTIAPVTNFLDWNFNPNNLDFRHTLQTAVDGAIARIHGNPSFKQDINVGSFASYDAYDDSATIKKVVGGTALAFFYLGLTATLVIGMNAIVNEKERNIRGYMRSLGMMDGPFWFSWFVEMMIFYILSVLIMMAFGYMFKLEGFTNTNFFVNFVIFLVYGIELVGLTFLLSALVSKTRAANILSFLIYFFGLGMAMGASLIGVIILQLYNPDVISVAGDWLNGLSFLPVTMFSVVVVDVIVLAVGSPYTFNSGSSSSVGNPGFSWRDLYKHPLNDKYVPMPYFTLLTMCFYAIAYFLLAWYLDNIVSDYFGARRKLYFPFQPSYWGFNKKAPYTHDFMKLTALGMVVNDEDLLIEMQHKADRETALRVVNLSKEYGSPFGGNKVLAVNMLNLQAKHGSIIALLGHNGAGKTTLINMLTGLTSATQGDAFIYGYSTTHDMDEIRSFTGVCPQFDVYWPELTAKEHIYIALGIKATNSAKIEQEVDEILVGVRLRKVSNHQIQTFSGGMRRRLSVALSMVGNPKIIILDEPTTGIDPANRRYIWDLISSIKKDKLVVLTTHSMEEADRLADKIAIMNRGHLSAIGTPLHLKSKFSNGYRLNLIVDIDKIPQVQLAVATMLPEAVLSAQNAGSVIYIIPDRTDQERISKFFSFLQNSPERIARDWGMSNTTMEDVFLRVTQHTHFQ